MIEPTWRRSQGAGPAEPRRYSVLCVAWRLLVSHCDVISFMAAAPSANFKAKRVCDRLEEFYLRFIKFFICVFLASLSFQIKETSFWCHKYIFPAIHQHLSSTGGTLFWSKFSTARLFLLDGSDECINSGSPPAVQPVGQTSASFPFQSVGL